MKNVVFDSPAFDDSLYYKVPEKLRAVQAPPLPQVKAVTFWTPDPNSELINSGATGRSMPMAEAWIKRSSLTALWKAPLVASSSA